MDNDALKKTGSTYVTITVIVTYRNSYIEKNGKKYLLLIGLGNSVAVNIILGLPTYCSWKIFLA